MAKFSRWIVCSLTLVLALQAPLAWAMNCDDHANRDAEIIPPMTMTADCHEKMEKSSKPSIKQSKDCCEGDCPCPIASSTFVPVSTDSLIKILASQFPGSQITLLPFQISQVPTPPPNFQV
tara:strand:- start:13004 stop:13366 length:363 start_codon:yes stop_codon:yes gene_type:complete